MTEPVALLAVRAHPDDESSATGGLLAKYGALGLRTGVVICTGGEEGEIHDPDLVYEEAFPRLGEIRERELRTACEVLGVAELRLLRYRDSGMDGTPSNAHPDAFCNADVDEAAKKLAAIIRDLRPTVIVTDNEHGGYGHPDHIMSHRITVRAWPLAADANSALPGDPWEPARLYVMASNARPWERMIELMREEGLDTSEIEKRMRRQRRRRREREREIPPTPITAAIDVSEHVEIRQRALLSHRTQIQPDSFGMSLPPHLWPRAFGVTYLHRLHPPPVDGEVDEDLFPRGDGAPPG